jgi:hypothetical protein
MKKIIVFAGLLFIVVSSKAQISKGSIYLGGAISYANSKEDFDGTAPDGKIKALSINPAVGIAIKENLVVGLNLNYISFETSNYQGMYEIDGDGFGAGLFARKYFPVAKRFFVFGEANAGFSGFDTKQTSPFSNETVERDTKTIEANLYPGVAYNLTGSLYLEAAFAGLFSISYSTDKETYKNQFSSSTNTTKEFAIQSSLSNSAPLSIGVRFIIPKKK